MALEYIEITELAGQGAQLERAPSGPTVRGNLASQFSDSRRLKVMSMTSWPR